MVRKSRRSRIAMMAREKHNTPSAVHHRNVGIPKMRLTRKTPSIGPKRNKLSIHSRRSNSMLAPRRSSRRGCGMPSVVFSAMTSLLCSKISQRSCPLGDGEEGICSARFFSSMVTCAQRRRPGPATTMPCRCQSGTALRQVRFPGRHWLGVCNGAACHQLGAQV